MLALDYGSARTGVAVSDPTGTVARPLEVVEGAGTETGIARVVELARREDVERIVVGLPVTLRGERGAQAVEERSQRRTAGPPVLGPLQDGVRAGRLHATTSTAEAVHATDLSLVCVGTPSRRNGT